MLYLGEDTRYPDSHKKEEGRKVLDRVEGVLLK